MPAFLSQEWLDLQCRLAGDLPSRPGATARIQVVVSGTPAGQVAYTLAVEDGRLAAASLRPDDEAEVTLAQTYDDARAIARGELDLNVAFMQGRVKAVGDIGALMAVMPLTQSPEYADLLASVAADTDL